MAAVCVGQSLRPRSAATDPDTLLPEARTCFFRIMLPHYRSKHVLRERLLFAITQCRCRAPWTSVHCVPLTQGRVCGDMPHPAAILLLLLWLQGDRRGRAGDGQ